MKATATTETYLLTRVENCW